jgi:hypothetical protein
VSGRDCDMGYLEANSHILCSCHAVPLRVEIVSFQFDLHSTTVFNSQVPCHDHAVLKATSQVHGTARHGHGMARVD